MRVLRASKPIRNVTIMLAVIVVAALSLYIWQGYAQAQTPEETSATQENTVGPTESAVTQENAATGNNQTPANQSLAAPSQYLWWGLWTIGGLLFVYLAYLLIIQNRYFESVERLGARGTPTEPVTVRASAGGPPPGAASDGTPPATDPLSVKGESSVAIGVSKGYVAKRGDVEASATSWRVVPEGAAAINPQQGATISLTPAKAGKFKLVATEGSDTVNFEIVGYSVAGTVKLPFVGEGYAAFAALLMVIPTVLVLAISKTISGDAVVGVLSAAIGFAFGRNLTSGGASTAPPANTNTAGGSDS